MTVSLWMVTFSFFSWLFYFLPSVWTTQSHLVYLYPFQKSASKEVDTVLSDKLSSITTPQNAVVSIVLCSQFFLTISEINNIELVQNYRHLWGPISRDSHLLHMETQ